MDPFLFLQVSCDLNPNEIPIQGSDEVPHLVQDMKFEAPEDLDASDKASSRATAWEQQGLDYHNYYRKRHGAPPLQLHPQVNKNCSFYSFLDTFL